MLDSCICFHIQSVLLLVLQESLENFTVHSSENKNLKTDNALILTSVMKIILIAKLYRISVTHRYPRVTLGELLVWLSSGQLSNLWKYGKITGMIGVNKVLPALLFPLLKSYTSEECSGFQFTSVQPLSHVRLSATPWTAAR